MKITTLLSISFFSLILFASLQCENEIIPEGKKTRVYGNFLDTINNLPIKNQKLYIGEFEDKATFLYGLRVNFIDNIDSVYTDQNGYYDITFTTTGLGDTYKIYPDYPTYRYGIYDGNYDINYKYNEIISVDYRQTREYTIKNENIGKKEEINITNFVHVYPCTLKINLDNIIHLPIYISVVGQNDYIKLEPINQATGTVERIVYINTSGYNPISFSRNLIGRNPQSTRIFEIEPTYRTESSSFEINLKNSDFK